MNNPIIALLLKKISDIATEETPKIIAELEVERFKNQGEFNDHSKWADNSPQVTKDKGRNDPLVDSGALKSELTNASNWKLKSRLDTDSLTISIPDEEDFTDSKYNILDTGGKTNPYTSARGNKVNIKSVPARPFKSISNQDVEWIAEELAKVLARRLA